MAPPKSRKILWSPKILWLQFSVWSFNSIYIDDWEGTNSFFSQKLA